MSRSATPARSLSLFFCHSFHIRSPHSSRTLDVILFHGSPFARHNLASVPSGVFPGCCACLTVFFLPDCKWITIDRDHTSSFIFVEELVLLLIEKFEDFLRHQRASRVLATRAFSGIGISYFLKFQFRLEREWRRDAASLQQTYPAHFN